MTTYSVYTCKDVEGSILYIGYTSRDLHRQAEHSRDKAWWPLVHRTEWEHFGHRKVALAREAELISQHRPPNNKVIPRGPDDAFLTTSERWCYLVGRAPGLAAIEDQIIALKNAPHPTTSALTTSGSSSLVSRGR